MLFVLAALSHNKRNWFPSTIFSLIKSNVRYERAGAKAVGLDSRATESLELVMIYDLRANSTVFPASLKNKFFLLFGASTHSLFINFSHITGLGDGKAMIDGMIVVEEVN